MKTSLPPNTPPPVIAGCIDACERCLAVIRSLTPEHFVAAAPGHSSVAAHLRHAIEHFVCFFNGLETGEIDYDARERDPLLESSPDAATGALTAIRDGLLKFPCEALSSPIELRLLPAPGLESIVVTTSIERELAYLATHTVHHVALAAMAAALQKIPTDARLALAVSTGEYLSR